MNKNLVVLAVFTIVFSASVVFSQTNRKNESTVSPVKDVKMDNEQSVIPDAVVPEEWGVLRGVVKDGGYELLFFEAVDGTIHVVRGYFEEGRFVMDESVSAAEIKRKE